MSLYFSRIKLYFFKKQMVVLFWVQMVRVRRCEYLERGRNPRKVASNAGCEGIRNVQDERKTSGSAQEVR